MNTNRLEAIDLNAHFIPPPAKVTLPASKHAHGDADTSLHSAFALALGIPLRRPKVEMRKQQDIPSLLPNRVERRRTMRAFRRAAKKGKRS